MSRWILMVILALLSHSATAAIVGVAAGEVPPPPTLGPYLMTPFPLDPRPTWIDVTDVPSPLGGAVEFSIPLQHRRIGDGWAPGDWDHGYKGDVYLNHTYGVPVTLYLPEHTMAFYVYASQSHSTLYDIWATADDGTTITQTITIRAKYYGFYQDDPAGPAIKAITVGSIVDFAVGEFGIAIPEPGALALLGAGALLGLRHRP